ncbi:hypothetical protein FHJ31_00485 [Pseudomonas sp. Fig-3]|uniref:hypothetical protein n=1 Tax=Pseudomonas TaxID=286 RepID=UPI00103C43B6|nr:MULTISPECIES: hypothetical protein [Pseudomonas]KAA6196222.1 hypothetical protein F3K52_05955 [Pseudomonas lactis]MBA1255171.1 hypothetical protein [Pseudomonas carnis]MBA1268617.1 hypothetical protein [Pseudomonas carnis]MBA1300258.1 hypothetical protein [Pseudomonas carnis]MBJ2261322.1 hypothetical protein [Pseudomonas sp. MF6787]
MLLLNLLAKLWCFINHDRRPDWEKAREREFIRAANSLKTLSVTDRGGVSIDPEELRDHINAAREQLKHLVHKPRAPGLESTSVADQGGSLIVEALERDLDCIEVVAWRRLTSGAAVRYTCLQGLSTGRFAVTVVSLFSEDAESLPRWIDSDTPTRVAYALQCGELHWFTTVSEAMDAWDAEL